MSPIAYIFVLLTIVAFTDSELVCPGFGFIRPQQPCVDQCSPGNNTCGSGMKCCYTPQTPCGYLCLVAKQNITKPGACPPQQSKQTNPNWLLCDEHMCYVDNDCHCKQQCCPDMCGSLVCVSSDKKR